MKKNVFFTLVAGAAMAAVLTGCTTTTSTRDTIPPMSTEPPPPPILAPTYMPSVPAQTHSIEMPVEPVYTPVAATHVVAADTKPSAAFDNIYVVKNGDALSKIAVAHGVRTRELMELNNITDANKIRIDQRLLLPAHAKASLNPPSSAAATKAPAAKAKSTAAAKKVELTGETYVVKNGDALSKIAAAHGVKTKDLMAANNIKNADKIFIGQKLVIPGAAAKAEAKPAEAPKAEEAPVVTAWEVTTETIVVETPAAPVMPAQIQSLGDQSALHVYTVQEGETLESIAHIFVVSRSELARENGLPEDAVLVRGQRLRIPSATQLP